MADYDFITRCNWTSTGTFTLQAFRGSIINVANSVTIYYRKVGDSYWNSTTNGQIDITATGEWEVGNDWDKVGDDALNHSYYNITSINSCTDVSFNTVALGANVGDYFMAHVWRGCTSLSAMPDGFTMPTNTTTVGDYFLDNTWYQCTSLSAMPDGFNLPQNITTVGTNFLRSAWRVGS